MENKNVECKLIFNAGIARTLLKKYGCKIVDIKPDHDNRDRTVFAFEKNERFLNAMKVINENMHNNFEEKVTE